MRLLRQDSVSEIDINNSQILINSFLDEFPYLYGTRNLSYNMHANIHLPEQVKLHGPLHKRNEYAGENCFKEMGSNYQGTNNIPHQIATNISIKNTIQSLFTPEEIEKIEKPQLKEFYAKLHTRKNSHQKHLFQVEPILIDPQIINYIDIGIEKNLLNRYFGDNYLQTNSIYTSSKVYFNRRCEYTIFYFLSCFLFIFEHNVLLRLL